MTVFLREVETLLYDVIDYLLYTTSIKYPFFQLFILFLIIGTVL